MTYWGWCTTARPMVVLQMTDCGGRQEAAQLEIGRWELSEKRQSPKAHPAGIVPSSLFHGTLPLALALCLSEMLGCLRSS